MEDIADIDWDSCNGSLVMNEYRYHANRDPQVAAVRSELAAMYRRIRKKDLILARILYVRTRAAYKILSSALIDNLYDSM